MASLEGIFAEPAGAAAMAGLKKDLVLGKIDPSAEVVCVSTGHGLKDPDIAITQSAKPKTIDADIESLRKLLEAA